MYIIININTFILNLFQFYILKFAFIATKENNTDEKILEKLKIILSKLTKNEYLNLKVLMSHIYRIGCLSRKNIFYGLSFIFGNYIFRKAYDSFRNSDELLSFLEVYPENKKRQKIKKKSSLFLQNSAIRLKHMKDEINESEIKNEERNNIEDDSTKTDYNDINIEDEIVDNIDYKNYFFEGCYKPISDPLCLDEPEFLYFFAKLDPIRLFMIIYLRVIILDFPSYVFYFFLNNFEILFSWTYAQTMKKIQIFKL